MKIKNFQLKSKKMSIHHSPNSLDKIALHFIEARRTYSHTQLIQQIAQIRTNRWKTKIEKGYIYEDSL